MVYYKKRFDIRNIGFLVAGVAIRVNLSSLAEWSGALKFLNSNPGWETQEFSKLIFISRNVAPCRSYAI